MNKVYAIFAKRLKLLREKNNISINALATQIGVSKVSVKNWEQMKKSPRTVHIYKIAVFFSVSIDYLIGLK